MLLWFSCCLSVIFDLTVIFVQIAGYRLKMKNDARILINKKKWKKQVPSFPESTGRSGNNASRSAVDARKIINLKRSKVTSRKQYIRESHKMRSSVVPLIKKTFSSNKVPNKQVELSSDGNIWITARSKGSSTTSESLQRNKKFASSSSIGQIQWIPADIDMDNVEHIGVNDVIDMESLPSAVVASNIQPQNRMTLGSRRSLAEEILSMKNTMVADQVASVSAGQSGRVFVTNLCPSVSKQDIMELFGDVGLVINAEMPQIGTAIIEFHDIADASRACEIYHNRLLDGQPMKCHIQSNASPSRVSISQRLGGRVQGSSVHLPLSLSSNPRSRYNPRDVRFTVKLA
ncbi:RRM domain-containing protein [Nephila pilipes]|uniref:RRM domain-containing protein n=1 Tax=Nephila pilipes TaxID=299642 RepID=A0A8X6K7A8_NEPPI|nr:RRM domain-containing protein [Nephila pilipes]